MPRLVIFFLATLAQFAWSDDGVDITGPSEVTALTGIQEKIDIISTVVTDCVNSGKDHGDCLCENEALILSFNQAVKQLFVTFPHLKTLDIVRFKTSTGEVVSQSLAGIEKQSEMKLTCI